MTQYAAGFPSAPLVDDSGNITPIWQSFFIKIFVRTGSGVGTSAADVAANLAVEIANRIAADAALSAAIAAESALAASAPGSAILAWAGASGAVVSNGTYQVALAWPWQSGTITEMVARAGSGAFTAALQIGGVPVASLGAVLVNSPTPAISPAGTNSLAAGNSVTLVISGAAGAPTDAAVQVNYTRSAT